MKKTPRKLKLSKETLRGLDTRTLRDVDGGALPNDPVLSLARTCTTCWSLACGTTRYC